jgi:hypothetical protein
MQSEVTYQNASMDKVVGEKHKFAYLLIYTSKRNFFDVSIDKFSMIFLKLNQR